MSPAPRLSLPSFWWWQVLMYSNWRRSGTRCRRGIAEAGFAWNWTVTGNGWLSASPTPAAAVTAGGGDAMTHKCKTAPLAGESAQQQATAWNESLKLRQSSPQCAAGSRRARIRVTFADHDAAGKRRRGLYPSPYIKIGDRQAERLLNQKRRWSPC